MSHSEILAIRAEVYQHPSWGSKVSFLDGIQKLDSLDDAIGNSFRGNWGMEDWFAWQEVLLLKAGLYDQLENYLESEPIYLRAMEIAEHQTAVRVRTAHYLYGNLANVYTRWGETEEAILLLEKGVQILRDSSENNLLARRLNDLSIAHQSSGDLKQSLKAVQEGLSMDGGAINTRAGLHQIAAGTLLDSFEISQDSSLLVVASDHLDSAFALFNELEKQGRGRGGQLSPTALWLRGKLGSFQADFVESESDFLQAKKTRGANSGYRGRGYAKVLLPYGEMLQRKGEYGRAVVQYQEALTALLPDFEPGSILENPVGSTPFAEQAIAEALNGKARCMLDHFLVHQETNYLVAILDALALSFQVDKKLREKYTYEGSKLAMAEYSHSRVELALETLCGIKSPNAREVGVEMAYLLIELSQGQLFGEAMRRFRLPGQVPEAMLAREQQILKELNRIQQQVEGADNDGYNALNEKLLSLGTELRGLRDSLKLLDQVYYSFRFSPKVADLELIQGSLLNDSTSMVQFFWGRRHLYRLWVSKGHSELRQLDKTGEVDSLIQVFHSIQARKVLEDALPHCLHGLYSALFIGLEDSLPKRLLVVPDGELWNLPFDALLTEETSELGYESPYLLRSSSCFYGFSATIQFWMELKRRTLDVDKAYWGIRPGFGKIPALNLLVEERPAIDKFIDRYGGGELIGEAATKANYNSEKKALGILHLASHADWNPLNPLGSSLVLEGERPGSVDSVSLAEVMAGTKEAGLVILEACESGTGTVRLGEGMESLAKGFAYSGANSILGTGWKVDKRNSEQMVDTLLWAFNSEEPVDIQLRKAKLAILSDPNISQQQKSIWNWSAFKPFGAMSPLEIEEEKRFWWGWILVLGILILALLIRWKRSH